MKSRSGGSPEPKYIDRPEITEVFADRLEHLFFDGGTVRMEFTVIRTDPAQTLPGKPIAEPKQWSFTACRVVLAVKGMAEMLAKMQELQRLVVEKGAPQAATTEAAAPEPASSPAP